MRTADLTGALRVGRIVAMSLRKELIHDEIESPAMLEHGETSKKMYNRVSIIVSKIDE